MEDELQLAFKTLADVNDDAKEGFGPLGIVVVGKTGAGKSTLIRNMGFVDSQGLAPEPVSGRPGDQDIRKIWRHEHLPVFVTDTNGIDTDAKRSLAEIKRYLDDRINLPDYFERVHIIWYVLSVHDGRIFDNGGLMELVSAYQSCHLQIIVTHNDRDSDGSDYETKVAQHLDEFLQHHPRKEELKKGIVKLYNGGKQYLDIPDNKCKHDAALERLSDETMAILEDDQKQSWAAAQTVDVKAKLTATAQAIVSMQYRTTGVAVLKVVPNLPKAMVNRMLGKIRDKICIIWEVPRALREAVWKSVLLSDLTGPFGLLFGQVLTTTAVQEAVGSRANALDLVPVAGTTIEAALPRGLTEAGKAIAYPLAALFSPAVLGLAFAVGVGGTLLLTWVYHTLKDKTGQEFRKIFVCYSVIVTGCILFVRGRYPGTWRNKTEEQYTALFKDDFVDEDKGRTALLQMFESEFTIQSYIEGCMNGSDSNIRELEGLLTGYFQKQV